jgi:choline dehydrogenase-like flavoprotein
MIFDIGTFAPNSPFDLCIVGGGAAGLTLAAELAQSGLRLLVLEAGDRQRSPTGQEHFRGEVADLAVHSPLDSFRVRALGGTSRIWGGRCLPYDPIDFADREWFPLPGWPISYETLLPYYERAHEAAEVGRFDYTPRSPIVPGLDGEALQTTLERFSRPTDFSKRYGDLLGQSASVHVVLNATVTAVRLTPAGDRVDHLEVVAPDLCRLRVRAANYVLAAGGLETTRLLLASNDIQADGIANTHGWLGRCYMCHLSAALGTVTFSGPPRTIAGAYERDTEGVYYRRRIGVTAAAQRRLRILNLAFRLHLPESTDPAHGDPVLSLIFLARYLVKYEYSRKAREAKLTPAQHLHHLANVVCHPIRFTRFVGFWMPKRYLSERRIPSIVLFSRKNRYALEFHSEQAPNPASRVSLIRAQDRFGMQRLRVDWRATPLDIETVRQSYRLLASELKRTGTGSLEFDEATLEQIVMAEGAYGGHHIGTARMSARPADGVVDPDCQVHGVSNLFVASAAVMPTSGQANPTLTVLALTLRLADHLRVRAMAQAYPYLAAKALGKAPGPLAAD